MKRLFALLLALSMLLSVLPAAAAEKETDSDDIWETISEIEDQKIRPKRGTAATAADYAAIVDDVIEAVEASDSYKQGTIERHGDFFFWETLDGEANGYSPRLRAQIRNSTVADEDAQTLSGIETVSYATRNSSDGTNVAVFQPYYGIDDSFTNQYKTEGESIAKVTGGTCTTYRTTSATIDAIADALESCAVVIFDSHGDTDYYTASGDYTSKANTSYICLQSGTGITSEDMASVNGTYGTYKHAYYAGPYSGSGVSGTMHYYCVDGTAIANHMEKAAPNNLLWMAICLGMATDGLHAPLREKGVGVVYGYSQSVTFYGDYFWEENFWNGMKNNKTVATAISEMKTKCGSWDYSQELYTANGWPKDSDLCTTITQAQRNRAAFPIVVSAEDTYPGQGNVDNLQTVYSTWTLKESTEPSYTFTAQSNNTAYGTVSVLDNVISVTPSVGCEVVGYTVEPSDAATVTKNGTTFVVTNLTANCTITINFRQKTVFTVSYSVPEGVTCAASSCYEGGSVKLAAPSGKPTAAPDAVFCGWATSVIEKTAVQPTGLLAAGSSYVPESNITLYAVYRWEGNYSSNPTLCQHSNTETVRQEATCTQSGFVKIVCKDCGAVVSETPINALGHNYVNGCCTRCGAPDPNASEHDCPCDDYSDLSSKQWYHEGVDYALSKGLMNGVGGGKFDPDGSLTRAMLVTILYRSENTPDVSGEPNPFKDVPAGQWYTNAVIWAAKEGIVKGVSETAFAPDESITREQIATILYRYDGSHEVGGNLYAFSDAFSVSTYAYDALRWAVQNGIINGIDGKLAPQDNATRAQIATILYRYLKK